MILRPFAHSDAEGASQVIRTCFTTMDLGGHSPQGIAIQLESNTPENLIASADKFAYFVAIEGSELIGIGGYGEGRIRTVFVNPDFHRHGIGTQIVKHVLAAAKKRGECSIECWSTFLAEPFYSKLGFIRTGLVQFPALTLIRMVIDLHAAIPAGRNAGR